MARFVHIEYPTQHGGVTRITRGLQALRSFHLGHGAVHALSVLGARSTVPMPPWTAARKQRAEDEKLWNLALTDARIMADLSRAMSQDALRDVRGYYWRTVTSWEPPSIPLWSARSSNTCPGRC